MRYRPTSHYINSMQGGSRRVVIVLVSIVLLFGYLMYFGPARPRDDPTGLFVIMALLAGAIGFAQIRKHRKVVAAIAATSYVTADEGISVESPDGSFVIPYSDIRGVTIKRYVLDKEIVQIFLKGQGGLAALPCLEMQESFVATLRERLGSTSFDEKRSLLM